ncbi:MAG TPA: YebC/PmpR family DNA-binding transcriptional regulator [Caldisericia bacterium]|nr:YebC/PmpR family DNA-binding transcriptional regulator [Caldisericia bacterium]HPF49491.1 YebC/PmpR family DNA-binding transcriptional regulator [Caldisericia bacterium]HPI84215.1 YebC/PmpR family DNA-binding transcriptional regulator [Caldisericia bacterium]HPQ93490.1 YebC/PmpR family DNA-binding transcriptional regulator [Caldisericia bacterium]HRV75504.1 YebC/PmpR family DNA-binding transcriptional regulator [Caldisericia bacterium]
MSGHSKWHNIQAKKSVTDAKRGKIFTKIAREIIVAAKEGGGDLDSNFRLRAAIDKANAASMPKANISKAIQRGTGEIEGATYEDALYEGYGPAGTAVIVEASTDNKNRTIAEFKKMFSKNGGSLGEQGCVSWNFTRVGEIEVESAGKDMDELFMTAADAGAEDISNEGEYFLVTTPPDKLHAVVTVVVENGFKVLGSKLTYNPKTTVKVAGKDAEKVLKLQDDLEDHDDVQNVYSNFEMSEDEMERIAANL